ncbi:DUF1203 domain-containing protein [Kitasatospora viridis]|uniref:Uncharacterized protein DUF1203 n=1 Tax=Kitasatospora viridis TaxID=281105 RepID=A0A561UFR0_9ACTN|nr:DUF1203 domain-containing protein [Kitasatospora viridis]TWF98202.1 uncharacterized protein DUF1203 [Kitasatospora viridis]
MSTVTTRFTVHPIAPAVLAGLRRTDDAGRPPVPVRGTTGGEPLRCCLRRAEPGADLLLLAYAPLRRWAAETGADPGPYDELGPVYVHARAADCPGAEPGYPAAMHRGDRVLRAYDRDGRILRGVLVEPEPAVAEEALDAMFSDPLVAVVHVRAVAFGCFQHEVRRAD